MFSKAQTVIRLSLFLLMSVSVHGGLLFVGWLEEPAEYRLPNAALVVSLRPATEVASRIASSAPEQLPESQPVARMSPRSTPQQPVPKDTPKRQTLTESHRVVKEEVKPSTSAQRPDMVCMVPQEPADVDPTSLFEEGPDASAPDHLVEMPVAAPGADTSGGKTVEAMPTYRSNPLPEYPYLARQRRWEGVVWLLVDVSVEGGVDEVRIEKSCGYKILDRSARRAVLRWRFSPATRLGLPVPSQARIPVRFRLEDG